MTIKEYAKKWNRDESNNFAVACYDNTISELKNALNNDVDDFDIKTWDLENSEEYFDAIQAALNEKLD